MIMMIVCSNVLLCSERPWQKQRNCAKIFLRTSKSSITNGCGKDCGLWCGDGCAYLSWMLQYPASSTPSCCCKLCISMVVVCYCCVCVSVCLVCGVALACVFQLTSACNTHTHAHTPHTHTHAHTRTRTHIHTPRTHTHTAPAAQLCSTCIRVAAATACYTAAATVLG